MQQQLSVTQVFEIVWDQGGVYRRFWGELTGAEYQRAQSAVWGDERFDDVSYAIVDFSAVTRFLTSRREVEELTVSNVGAFQTNPRLRVAFVTTDQPMATLIRSMADLSAYPLHLFETLAQARAWVATGE